MIVTKKALPRRTVLRGIGAAVALPLLDSMVPAFTALAKTAANPTKRFVWCTSRTHRHEPVDAGDRRCHVEFRPTLKPLCHSVTVCWW